MWIPKSIVDWITTVKLDESSKLREENASLRAERDTLKHQLSTSQFQLDWFRGQINTLQLERSALMDKAYGIKVPTPELVKLPIKGLDTAQDEFSFDDLGDEVAKRLGLPTYEKQ